MTISDKLYKKYEQIQRNHHIQAELLGNEHKKKVEMIKEYKNDNKTLIEKAIESDLFRIKTETAFSIAVSEILREFLLEIAMENKEE